MGPCPFHKTRSCDLDKPLSERIPLRAWPKGHVIKDPFTASSSAADITGGAAVLPTSASVPAVLKGMPSPPAYPPPPAPLGYHRLAPQDRWSASATSTTGNKCATTRPE